MMLRVEGGGEGRGVLKYRKVCRVFEVANSERVVEVGGGYGESKKVGVWLVRMDGE